MNENPSDDEKELEIDEFIEWFVQEDLKNYSELDRLLFIP